jgi:hypothetical protein
MRIESAVSGVVRYQISCSGGISAAGDEMSRGVPFIEQWFVMINFSMGNKYAISPRLVLSSTDLND